MSKETQSKKKHAGGRPTKYDPKYAETIMQYIAKCKEGDVYPQVEELAIELGINTDTMYEWRKDHKEFSESMKFLKATQIAMLRQNGLTGKFNARMAMFVLSANHGEVEQSKQNIDLKSEGFVVNIIEEKSKK